jgi:hypothetical protein
VLVVEQDEGGGGDRADPPRAQADPAQCLEGGLEQGVAAFGRRPGGRVQQVDGALVVGSGRSATFFTGMVSAARSPS